MEQHHPSCTDTSRMKYERNRVYESLTVVDMQNDFITGTLGNKECQAVVGNVVNVINTGNYDKIIATRDTHFEGYLNTQEGKNFL